MSGSPLRPAGTFFLAVRLPAFCLAELLFLAGNLLPGRVAAPLWRLALALNPAHGGAAAARATALAGRDLPAAWGAFETLLAVLENRRGISASDLHLSRAPGRWLRRMAARALGSGGGPGSLQGFYDATLIDACRRLAERSFRRALDSGHLDRAGRALAAWRSAAGDGAPVDWADVEVLWLRGSRDEACRRLRRLLEDGRIATPSDPLVWAGRLLDAERLDDAAACLESARDLLPEVAEVWNLLGTLSARRGEARRADSFRDRCLALDPQHLECFLARLGSRRGTELRPVEGPELLLEVPETVSLGDRVEARCTLAAPAPGWTLFVLPPAGWGVVPEPRELAFDASGEAVVGLAARRPDRIRGGPWPLVFLAVGPAGFVSGRRDIRVPDPRPGSLLVTVTEDHEIHEERGELPAALLRRLLVDKSSQAARQGVAWTHMVETGSALALIDWAAGGAAGAWSELGEAISDHLIDEVERGNDIQPHLHAFNDPEHPDFPFSAAGDALRPSLRFLLTSQEARGSWASGSPPPAGSGRPSDRLRSVERSAARVEALGRLGDPDYRAVLWRSGALDFGRSPGDRAWSTVALRRAGLRAVSDLPKPRASFRGRALPAFPCAPSDPATVRPGGPLLQLPIAANLEGDFIMGRRLLRRRAARSARASIDAGGRRKPGVHLFTLLTHDKFINARRGGDEFRLDGGDWRVVAEHLEAWRRAGARFVTAREGVRAALDDLSWRPVGWLEGETFVAAPEPGATVRYSLTLLGEGIPCSPRIEQHVPVPVPASLRGSLLGVEAEQAGRRIACEPGPGSDHFWMVLDDLSAPIFCRFRLSEPLGPAVLAVERLGADRWRLDLVAGEPFRRARLLLPWGGPLEPRPGVDWRVVAEGPGRPECRALAEGLLLGRLFFARPGGGEPAFLRLTLSTTGGGA